MDNLIFDSAILILLILYCFFSGKLTKEMQLSAEWSLKQMRLTQFRAGFGPRIDQYTKNNEIIFHTLYLSYDNFEKQLVKQILTDMKEMNK